MSLDPEGEHGRRNEPSGVRQKKKKDQASSMFFTHFRATTDNVKAFFFSPDLRDSLGRVVMSLKHPPTSPLPLQSQNNLRLSPSTRKRVGGVESAKKDLPDCCSLPFPLFPNAP